MLQVGITPIRMVDLTGYNLTIGRAAVEIADWFRPVFDRGRGAAFIDTGFFKGLFFDRDHYATIARNHFRGASGINFYTTNLVLAEIVRQITKDGGANQMIRNMMFDNCTDLLIDSHRVFVCAPPQEVMLAAYEELREARAAQPRLDLCDALSIIVLEHAQHRRVFGFDNHFSNFGAQLEP
jgi:predicted nucleic acid-binding protein